MKKNKERKKTKFTALNTEKGVCTGMPIYGDRNSNIEIGICLDKKWLKQKAGFMDASGSHKINVVLINPPYNAIKKCCNQNEVVI